MAPNETNNERLQTILDECARDARPQYKEHVKKFQELDRWTGNDPVMLVVDAALSATGLNYADVVKPAGAKFKKAFVETGKVTSFDDLIALENDPKFEEQVTAGRPGLAYKIPLTLYEQYPSDKDDLIILQDWATNAIPENEENEENDPVRELQGVGLATFQYLRMIAGVDTAKPDIQVTRFLEALEEENLSVNLNTDSQEEVLNSCRELANQTSYSMLEIDQIAWWCESDTTSVSPSH